MHNKKCHYACISVDQCNIEFKDIKILSSTARVYFIMKYTEFHMHVHAQFWYILNQLQNMN